MKQRLEQFLAAENISKAQFADRIGVARAAVSHIIAGRNNPGYEFIVNTMSEYPQLNIEWLLTGVGKMYKSSDAEYSDDESTLSDTLNSTSYHSVPMKVTSKSPKVKKIFVLYEDGTYGEFC